VVRVHGPGVQCNTGANDCIRVSGGTIPAQWEDVTGTTPLTFVNDTVVFTTSVSARLATRHNGRVDGPRLRTVNTGSTQQTPAHTSRIGHRSSVNRKQQVIAPGAAGRYAPPPMAVRLAADLRPSADGSAVRTSLVAGGGYSLGQLRA